MTVQRVHARHHRPARSGARRVTSPSAVLGGSSAQASNPRISSMVCISTSGSACRWNRSHAPPFRLKSSVTRRSHRSTSVRSLNWTDPRSTMTSQATSPETPPAISSTSPVPYCQRLPKIRRLTTPSPIPGVASRELGVAVDCRVAWRTAEGGGLERRVNHRAFVGRAVFRATPRDVRREIQHAEPSDLAPRPSVP